MGLALSLTSRASIASIMRIECIEIIHVSLPLLRTFVTSSSIRERIDHLLVRVDCGGVQGWGECSAPIDPFYCPETTGTSSLILKDFLAPLVLGRDWDTIGDLVQLYAKLKGNNFAKSGLETACWDAFARARGASVAELIGGTRSAVESGVSLGVERDLGVLFDEIDRRLSEGYKRIKLKITPGWDVDVVSAVRRRHPSVPLQVDANSAYTLQDLDCLKALDDFGLLLIEQPLGHDDLIDHAKLQSVLRTPVCLDESIHSSDDARKALEIGACRVVNIKLGRVGGLLEAKSIHDLCFCQGIPVWCGGMHEFGVGRWANVALASLPGFSLPGDVSGSDKYYAEDLVDPPVRALWGSIAVPSRPGFGFEVLEDRIKQYTVTKECISEV